MATDTLTTETLYATREAAQAAAKALPALTKDLPPMVKVDLKFKLGNKGFRAVKALKAARVAEAKAEKAKKAAQKELDALFDHQTENRYGAVGTYRGVDAVQVAYGTSQATVDLETLKIAFPEAFAATVTPAKRYTYWK